MKESGIYCIENLINGKKYIGQSINLSIRINQTHKGPLCDAIRKYKRKNFKKTILIYCEKWELNRLEIECIKIFYSHVSESGYNITWGGDYSYNHPDISGENNPMYSKKHSMESIEKMIANRPDYSGKNNPNFGNIGKNNPKFGKKSENTASKYHGVSKLISKYKSKEYIYWITFIGEKHIGIYKTEIEAAQMYDKYIINNSLDRPTNFIE
jgi:group I intron endonuclease